DGLGHNVLLFSLAAPDGSLWFTYDVNPNTTPSGVTRYDGKRFIHFSEAEGVPKEVRQMAATRSGDVWFATRSGLMRYDGQRFTLLTDSDGLPSSIVSSLAYAPDDSLWLGTANGVSHYQNGKFTNYGQADGVPNVRLFRAFLDVKGRPWFSLTSVAGGGALLRDGEKFRRLSTEDGMLGNTL